MMCIFYDAIRDNSLNVIQKPIAEGVFENTYCCTYKTPLIHAIDFNNLPFAEYLLKNGSDANFGAYLPLIRAIITGNCTLVQLLLDYKANMHKPNADSTTPFRFAQKCKYPEIVLLFETHERNHKFRDDVKQLIANRANIDEIDFKGNTPLGQAIILEDTQIIDLLIKSKANVSKKGKNGNTPLSLAVQKGNIEIIKNVLKHGAGEAIQSTLLEAITLSKVEIVKLFVKEGALFNVTYRDATHL